MPLRRVAEEFAKRPRKAMTIGVGIDGSDMSDRALQVATSIYSRIRGDRLVILHVADPSKTWLPRHLHPHHLANTYQAKAFDLVKTDALWGCCDKKPGQSTCMALTELAEAQGVDLLVVGSFGRKGSDGKIDLLGSVADSALRESHASVAIVRPTAPPLPPSGARTWLCASDGSHASALAFCVLVNRLAKPGDRVIVATIGGDSSTGAVDPMLEGSKAQMTEMMAVAKVEGECLACHLPRDQTVADRLLELVRSKGAHTLVVGISGYGNAKLGSVSEDVSVRALCNTVVIKDSSAVLSSSIAGAGAKTLSSIITPSKGSPAGAAAAGSTGTGSVSSQSSMDYASPTVAQGAGPTRFK